MKGVATYIIFQGSIQGSFHCSQIYSSLPKDPKDIQNQKLAATEATSKVMFHEENPGRKKYYITFPEQVIFVSL